MSNPDARAFYGDAYDRAKDPAKLDQAYERLQKAVANETAMGGTMSKVGEGMLKLACQGEKEAFAG